MARPVVIQRHPKGPRVYVADLRLHHGASGCALALLGLLAHRRPILAAGLALVAHDLHDARVWFAVERLSATLAAVAPEALP